jgi:hypothetical protein
MRELLILILIGAVAYLAYDDYYKQRPALLQAQADVQQLQQNSVRLSVRAPTTPTPPAWFKERIEAGASLDSSRRHKQPDPSRP